MAETSIHRQHTPPTHGNNITSIETRSDLTTLYRVLRTIIRPLRPRLTGIKPLNYLGSPPISKRPSSHYGVEISERPIQIPFTSAYPLTQADPATNTQRLYLYDHTPKSLPESKESKTSSDSNNWWTHTIYYFAGGGFQAPGSAEHWKLTARLAKDLAPQRVRVIMLSYPLAPKSPAKDSLPFLRAWLAQTLSETSRTNETISLMGDSAGANVALTLAFWWCATLSHKLETNDPAASSWKNLSQIVVMSPPCDFRNINPAIAHADLIDPVLTREVTGTAADEWCRDWDSSPLTSNHTTPYPSAAASSTLPTDHKDSEVIGGDRKMRSKSDPALSPNLQTPEAWKALRDSGLVIHGIVGTADLLAPDARVFMERCEKEKIKGKWLVWEGQMHCFPLTVCYGLGEGREGYDWVRRRVEEGLVQ